MLFDDRPKVQTTLADDVGGAMAGILGSLLFAGVSAAWSARRERRNAAKYAAVSGPTMPQCQSVNMAQGSAGAIPAVTPSGYNVRLERNPAKVEEYAGVYAYTKMMGITSYDGYRKVDPVTGPEYERRARCYGLFG